MAAALLSARPKVLGMPRLRRRDTDAASPAEPAGVVESLPAAVVHRSERMLLVNVADLFAQELYRLDVNGTKVEGAATDNATCWTTPSPHGPAATPGSRGSISPSTRSATNCATSGRTRVTSMPCVLRCWSA
jgi:hypothetical protein